MEPDNELTLHQFPVPFMNHLGTISTHHLSWVWMPIVLCFHSSVFAQNNDYLYLTCKGESGDYGYVDKTGNVVIPFGNYPMCFTDTLKTFAFVYSPEEGIVAIDKHERVLFHAYVVDNGPDYPSEGLFRIKENKVGFADESGEIIIKPEYDDALPFSDGLAAVCFGCSFEADGEYTLRAVGKWGFINKANERVVPLQYDKVIHSFQNGIAEVEFDGKVFKINQKGKEIKDRNMDRIGWLKVFQDAVTLLVQDLFKEELTVEFRDIMESTNWNFTQKNFPAQKMSLTLCNSDKTIARFVIVPRQHFHKKSDSALELSLLFNHLTVTDYAIFFSLESPNQLSHREKEIKDNFINEFKKLIDYQRCQGIDESARLKIPEGVQTISVQSYPHYLDIQVAVPGSRLPSEMEWSESVQDKMIWLHLIPDRGEIKTSWIQAREKPDSCYASLEDSLIRLFKDTIQRTLQEPNSRTDIYNQAGKTLRNLFCTSKSDVNDLFLKYDNRLIRWLRVHDANSGSSGIETLFPDYEPKTSLDTALDYMPSLVQDFETIPGAKTGHIVKLIRLFAEWEKKAHCHPGTWEEGNVILGAREKEYRPSLEELVLAEIGERIQLILEGEQQEQARELIRSSKIATSIVYFKMFTFTHVDVMGSGRFFYVETMHDVSLTLK